MICLDIFEDDAWEKLIPIEVVAERFRKNFDEVSNDDDIREAFRTEEALLELDTKLRDFAKTRIEVDNYTQKVKDKYNSLDLPDVAQVTKIIEKFKGKYLDLALG